MDSVRARQATRSSSMDRCSSRPAAKAQVVGPERQHEWRSGVFTPPSTIIGDPFLQRQNEPSIAVSSRNPCHLLAGAQ